MRAELRLKIAICAALVAITWAVFSQTLGHDFVDYDDPKYVYENSNVVRGLSSSGVFWAFTHFDQDNWHPLTSISHMLDSQLFGLRPAGHHFTNSLLHALAVVLLFLVLQQMTGGPSSPRRESVSRKLSGPERTGTIWRSAFVAAIFAIHPLHVESVAWIAERKDVLSGVFFMLTLSAYARYTQQPTLARYIAVAILFACGLMSKAMLVTLPIVLLLLDYWPLHRFGRSTNANLVLEKIPLVLLSVTSSIATLLAQRNWLVRLEELPFRWRAANALSACVLYIWQMIWPAKLAVIYPHRATLPLSQTTGAIALLVAITLAAFILRRRFAYLLTGWCWYLIMLVPVLGLIKVGGLAHADRYTYLPQLGLYLAVTWGIVDLANSWRHGREVLAAAAAVIITGFTWRACIQTSYWRDSETIWRHTLAATKKNDLAHFTLAEFLSKHQRIDEAIMEYQSGLSIDPNNSDAETALANLFLQQGRGEEAVAHYRIVVRLQPSSALAHYNLAVGLHRLGRLSEAIVHYKEALTIDPGYPDAESFLRQALLQNGQPDEARLHLEKR